MSAWPHGWRRFLTRYQAMQGSLRHTALCSFACVLHYAGLFRLRRFIRRVILRRNEICVLGLHRVLSKDEEAHANSLPGIVLKAATFEKMLEFLGRRFRVATLDDFLQSANSESRPSKPLCLITFDDGWKDNYTTAFPLLKKYGLPAAIFLVSGLVENAGVFWTEQLIRVWRDPARRQKLQRQFAALQGAGSEEAGVESIIEHLKHMPAKDRQLALAGILPEAGVQNNDGDAMLTWEEVLAMHREGVEFESHTITHPLLVYEDDQSVQFELRDCKQTLEEKLSRKIRAFAYPNGTWDNRVRAAAQDAGYECAFTTERGLYRQGQDPFTIRRIMLHEGNVTGLNGKFSPAVMSLRLSGWY